MNTKRRYGNTLLIIISLITFSTSASAVLRLASWNTLHIGWENDKNYTAVATVAAQFDLLAVQELMDPVALARLDRSLEQYTGAEWGHLASKAEGRTSYQEHYGFLWRTGKVKYTGKAASYIDERDLFAREPFSALFQSLDTGQTIALATVHIRFGDSQADRRPEIRALGHYWQWLATVYPDADLQIITGDMNMPPDDPAWQVLDRSAHALITRGRTTLSTTPGKYASLYDQIFVPDGWASQHRYTAGIFVYPTAYDWGWAVRDEVSDHLPVYLIIGASQFKLRPPQVDLAAVIGGHAETRPLCIRLNAAPASRIDELPHVGPARAADIVAGRPWASVDALVAIDGLGDARVDDIAGSGLLCEPVT